MKATGKILGVKDYAFTAEQLKFCNENDCLIKIDLYINTRKRDTINVQFKKPSNLNIGETLFTIDKVSVFGFAPETNSLPYAYSVRKNLGR
jgi:hypothetical protein